MNDAAYKRLLDHRRPIKDLFLGFIAPLRPPGWAATLDFESLRSINGKLSSCRKAGSRAGWRPSKSSCGPGSGGR